MAFERTALKTYLGTLLSTDATLLGYCVGGVHYRTVVPMDALPDGFPSYVNPTVVWDLAGGPDDNTAGDRALTGMIVTVKVIGEQDPTADDKTNSESALSRIATLLDKLRDVQDGVRIRFISAGTIDFTEKISGGRYLDHVGRQYTVQLSQN